MWLKCHWFPHWFPPSTIIPPGKICQKVHRVFCACDVRWSSGKWSSTSNPHHWHLRQKNVHEHLIYHIISYLISYYIILYHIISYYIILNHIISRTSVKIHEDLWKIHEESWQKSPYCASSALPHLEPGLGLRLGEENPSKMEEETWKTTIIYIHIIMYVYIYIWINNISIWFHNWQLTMGWRVW